MNQNITFIDEASKPVETPVNDVPTSQNSPIVSLPSWDLLPPFEGVIRSDDND